MVKRHTGFLIHEIIFAHRERLLAGPPCSVILSFSCLFLYFSFFILKSKLLWIIFSFKTCNITEFILDILRSFYIFNMLEFVVFVLWIFQFICFAKKQSKKPGKIIRLYNFEECNFMKHVKSYLKFLYMPQTLPAKNSCIYVIVYKSMVNL